MRYGIYDERGRWLCHTLDEAIHMAAHRAYELSKMRMLLLYEKDELLHEIASMAWVQADTDIEADETTDNKAHNYKEVKEPVNWPMVGPWITLAVAKVEQMLYNSTRIPTTVHRSMDNQVTKKIEFAIEMRVHPETSENTINLIMGLANEYIKAKVLREWSGLTYKAALPYWDKQMNDLEEQIREAGRSCENMHHVKRPMWPAW